MKLKIIIEDTFGEQYEVGQVEMSYEDAFYSIMEGLNIQPKRPPDLYEDCEKQCINQL